jgi:hypothetical protein
MYDKMIKITSSLANCFHLVNAAMKSCHAVGKICALKKSMQKFSCLRGARVDFMRVLII